MSEGYTKESKPEPTAMTVREQRLWALGKVATILIAGALAYFGIIPAEVAKQAVDAYPMSQEPSAKQVQPDQPKALSDDAADDQPTPAPTLLPVARIDVLDLNLKPLDVASGSVEVKPGIPVIITAANSVFSSRSWGRTETASYAIPIPDGFVLVPAKNQSTTFFLAVQSGDVLATTQLLVTCELAPNPPPDDEPKPNPIPDNASKTILERLDNFDQRLTALEGGKVKPVPDVVPDPVVVGQKFNVQVIYDVHDKVTDRSVKTSTVTSSAAFWAALRLRGHTATIHPTGTHNEQAQDAIRWAAAKGRAPPLLAVRKADGTIVDVVSLPGTTADVDSKIRELGGV